MAAKKKIATKTAKKKPSTAGASSLQAKRKISQVLREFKKGKLHSRSKKGPKVKSRTQAIAIALSEAGASSRNRASKKKSSKKR